MVMLTEPMGRGYQTNCYILIKENRSIIIDPGINAVDWIVQNAKNPLAVLNTHGHFDHTFSNAQLQREFEIPVYIHNDDAFLLGAESSYLAKKEPCIADVRVSDEEWITIGEFVFRFMHFPGHTPGCCMIEFGDRIFSGDFIFDNSIGRCDFPSSSPNDMRKSLSRFIDLYCKDKDDNRPLYPGHGKPTTIHSAMSFIPEFIRMLSR
ncbi:hydrolase [Campylobacterota bacterium]|nr:hydrolase [Campylobacterota bacterium]